MPPTPELRAQRRRVAELDAIVKTCKQQLAARGLSRAEKTKRQRALDAALGQQRAAQHKLDQMERRAKRERGR